MSTKRPSITVLSDLIQQYVGSDFDKVEQVAANLDALLATTGLTLAVDVSDTSSFNEDTLGDLLNALAIQVDQNTSDVSGLSTLNDSVATNGASLAALLANIADIEANLSSGKTYQGGYDANTNTPDLEAPAVGAVLKGYSYDVTAAGTFNLDDGTIVLTEGDSIRAAVDNPADVADWVHIPYTLNAATIKTQYESNADTNAYDDAAVTKLAGIETGATADQTGAEIVTLYEAEANTWQGGTDRAKLDGIEAGATADQTGAEIKTAYEAELDTNAFTDAYKALVDTAVQENTDVSLDQLTINDYLLSPAVTVPASITDAQGQAPITSQVNTITSGGNDYATTLPNVADGMTISVYNSSSYRVKVYPALGETIMGELANDPVTISAGHLATFAYAGASTWVKDFPTVSSDLSVKQMSIENLLAFKEASETATNPGAQGTPVLNSALTYVTVDNNNDSVTLPDVEAVFGEFKQIELEVQNLSATNALIVYPNVNGTIDDGLPNAGATVAPLKRVKFYLDQDNLTWLTNRQALLLPFVVDEDDMAANTAQKVPTQQSVVAWSDYYRDQEFANNNLVVVNDATDLPTAVANVITLAANTTYLITKAISIGADRLVMANNTQIAGTNPKYSSITSTTTGALITAGSGITHMLKDCKFSVASGSFLDLNGGSTETAYYRGVEVTAQDLQSSIDNWYAFFWDQGAVVTGGAGFLWTGTCNLLIMDLVEFIIWDNSISVIDLGTATFDTLSFVRCGFQGIGGTGQYGIDKASGDANMNAGKQAKVTECVFGTPLTDAILNYDSGDIQWNYHLNDFVGDSSRRADLYMQGNATGTSASTTPAVIAGTWTEAAAKQFTTTAGGRATYDGLRPANFHVAATLFAAATSGSSQKYYFSFAKNGTVLTETKSSREFTTSTPGSLAIAGEVELENGDYLECFVEKATGSDTMTVEDIHFVITQVD